MKSIQYSRDELQLLDQTKLPFEEIWDDYHTAEEVAQAIREMKVRGAPAIGAAGAFGIALEAKRLGDDTELRHRLYVAIETLRRSRPTAVNLGWALDRMQRVIETTDDNTELANALFLEAQRMAVDDVRINQSIGDIGAKLFHQQVSVLTHCNTGALATVGYGTALGIIRSLHRDNHLSQVFVDETRPYLQGSRLTAFELTQEGIPYDIITDNMAGHLMKLGLVDVVLVGADRVACNGDTANKIGTYSLAVLAHYHSIPFYVAAPISTIDLGTSTGNEIPIEERDAHEVTHLFGQPIAPKGATARHPAFDVTPSNLITGIVTERGVAQHPYHESLVGLVNQAERKNDE